MNAIIAFSLRMRALMVAFFVLVMIAGGVAFTRLNIEAYPDPVPPLVDIVTQNPGQSAEEIERYITIPIEIGVATAPYLSAMRSISLFGLSDVKLQFTYDLTYEEAEQKVLNRPASCPRCRIRRSRPSHPGARPAKSIATNSSGRPHRPASLEPARSPLRYNGSLGTPDCFQRLEGRQRRACQKTGSRIPRQSLLLW
jgi:hypothetical protein